MAKKVLSLDNLKVIKSYIDDARYETTKEIDASTKEYLDEQLSDASTAIKEDYESKYKELIDKIAYVEQFGSAEELKQLQMQLDALKADTNNKFDALDSLKTDLSKLNGEYDNLNIKYNSIFSPGQLDEVIRTALIKGTAITDDMIEVPNLFATKIVSLIGNFGKISAGQIDAGTMRGSSIESANEIINAPNPNKVKDGEPVWKIDNEGDGWFARGNIHWDEDGNVTLGPGVKIKWESVEDGNSVIEKLLENKDEELRDYVNNFVTNELQPKATKEELKEKYDDAKKSVEDLQVSLSQEIAINKEAAEEAVKNINDWIEHDYDAEQTALKNHYDGVTAALDQAIKDGNTELAEKLKRLQEEIDYKMEKTYADYVDVMHAVGLVSKDMENLKESALTKYDAADLLAASLITETVWDKDHVATPTLLAKKIVGLVGTFGLIKASKIQGTTIQGYTVSAPDEVKDEYGNVIYTETNEYQTDENGKPVIAYELNEDGSYKLDEAGKKIPMTDENGDYIYVIATELDKDGNVVPKKVPAKKTDAEIPWMLKSDGTGWIADHMISWDYEKDDEGEYKLDNDGNKIPVVNIDPDVKFTWNQITNKPEGSFKFKSTAFKRTNADISTTKPSGGNYTTPIPTGWSDGIPSGEEQLWATTATVAWSETGTYNIDWSLPKKMTDTSDFEVIYSPKTNAPAIPDGFSKNGVDINEDWKNKANTAGWYDEVTDFTGDAIWMATNKAKNGTWQGWEISKIKGEKGDTGASTFKSTVFKRYTPTAAKPVPDKPGDDKGSYDNPVPEGWSDGIPSGDASIPIFSTYRNFGKLGGKQDGSWSTPQLMADTADFDVEYCTKETYSNPPSEHPNTNTSEWSSEPSTNAIWMATSSMKNGSWTDWTISRIKGETGNTGGTGPAGRGIKTQTFTYQAGSSASTTPSGTWQSTVEAANVPDGGYLWTRTETIYTDSNTPVYSYSVSRIGKDGDVGKTGPGVKSMEIKYYVSSDLSHPSDTSTSWNTEFPTNALTPGKYLWTQNKTIFTDGSGLADKYSYSVSRIGENGTVSDAAIETAIGRFNITSNLISGKTISSTEYTTNPLPSGTQYFDVDPSTGLFAEGHQVYTDTDGKNSSWKGKYKPYTSDGTDAGPMWQIGWNGVGYLAGGNINWNSDGDLTVKSVNGGTVQIGEGVGVGPWNTFKEGSVSYIGDSTSFSASKNVFGDNGTFKIGGDEGIVKASKDGSINLGSAVEFGGSGGGSESEDTWKFEGNIAGTNMIAVYIGGPYTFKFDYNGSTNTGYLWVDSETYNTIDISNLDNSLVNLTTAYYTTTSPNASLTSFSIASSIKSYDASTKTFTYGSPYSGTISACYFGANGGLTQGDLEEWWGKTKIDGGKITTGKISANVIDVDNLKIKQLDTMELSDYSSGKYNGKSGTITVSGDTIRVYDSVNFNAKNQPEILRITGTPLDNTLPTAETASISAINKNTASSSTSYIFDKRYKIQSLINDPNISSGGSCDIYENTDSTSGKYVEVYLYKKIASGINVGDSTDANSGFDFYNKTNVSKKLNFGVGIDRSGAGSGMPGDEAKITFYDFSYIASGEILFFNTSQSIAGYKTPFVPTTNTGYIFDGNGSRNTIFAYGSSVDSTDISATSINLDSNNLKSYICWTEEREFSDGKKVVEVKNVISTGVVNYGNTSYGTCVPAGSYDVYVRAKIKFLSNSAANASKKAFDQIIFLGDSSDSHADAYRSYMYHSNFDCEKYVPSCMDISSHGVKFNASNTKYVTLAKDGSFILKNGNYAVIVSDNGLAMGFGDGKYYKITRDSSGNLKASTEFTL